jgi:hypothetical protein
VVARRRFDAVGERLDRTAVQAQQGDGPLLPTPQVGGIHAERVLEAEELRLVRVGMRTTTTTNRELASMPIP